MNWSAPKGTRDFYPQDMILREHIFSHWEKTCRNYGFESYDAPVFEHIELYTQKSGDEIEGQLYAFDDKGGRRISLRPELTPSLARMVAAKGPELKKPIKWFSIPKLFRYEKMQKGRLREFFQLNMDILGVEGVSADAELISAAIDTMRDLGLTDEDITVHISSRTLLEELFLYLGVKEDQLKSLYALLDRMLKMDRDSFIKELTSIVESQEKGERIAAILESGTLETIEKEAPDLKALSEIKQLFAYLDAYKLQGYYRFDISIVRGLAYYTGTVFEIFDKKKSMRAIAGGGRYDKLVELYGGKPTPAVGFATGDVVLSDLLKDKGLIPEARSKSDLFIINFESSKIDRSIEWAQKLRSCGISTEYSLTPVNRGKQQKQAEAARSKVLLFIGSQEEIEGRCLIKITGSGEDHLVAVEDVPKKISEILERI